MKRLPKKSDSIVLREAPGKYSAKEDAGTMVRTQVYLTKEEHGFVQFEAKRDGKTMAEVIRGWIDEKMIIPENVWAKSPLLQPPAGDTDFDGREDGAINHDHYIYGGPKKYAKVKGKWVLQPPLP